MLDSKASNAFLIHNPLWIKKAVKVIDIRGVGGYKIRSVGRGAGAFQLYGNLYLSLQSLLEYKGLCYKLAYVKTLASNAAGGKIINSLLPLC